MRRKLYRKLRSVVGIAGVAGIALLVFGAALNWPGRIGIVLGLVYAVGEAFLFTKHPDPPANDVPIMNGDRPFQWGREPGPLGHWLSD